MQPVFCDHDKTSIKALEKLASRVAPAGLRLVATTDMGFPIGSAGGCALGFVFLGQRLLADLVVVVGYLASLGFLGIAGILLLGCHENFLVVDGRHCA